jgi:hypothetical protein|tara:strand:- start:11791 stop:12360 length:570 start_codon:yes stop_codon:yes gene_type:complete
MATKKNPKHYVNNKDFAAALIDFKIKVEAAEDSNKQRPMITNYIAECFMKIATHLSFRQNFIKYPFREEMVMDGVENCLQYMDNFDARKALDLGKTPNPFAYFTRIIWFAFLRRIAKEKKLLYVKYKMTERQNIVTSLDKAGYEQDSGSGSNSFTYGDTIKASEWSQEYQDNFVREFEATKRRKKKKKK